MKVISNTNDWTSDYKSNGQPCYASHKTLHLGTGLLHGGSCSVPVEGADIYVGLDYSMKRNAMMFPWNKGEAIQFLIQDGHAPNAPEEFRKMIDWLAVQLTAGATVHVGCIGGHGRTGTVLAALVRTMLGEKDAIRYVREHYCQKAVETVEQVSFLSKFYDVLPAEPTRARARARNNFDKVQQRISLPPLPASSATTFAIPSPSSIWGPHIKLTNHIKTGMLV